VRQRKLWWMVSWGVMLLCLVGSVSAQDESLQERVDRLEQAFKTSEHSFRVYWKDGVRLETLDKEVEIRFGGRIQFDMNFFFPNDEVELAYGDSDDRFFFRRARLFVRGTLYKIFDFKAEYDFVGDDDFTDVYIRMKHVPFIGNIYAGKFKVPFGLEELTSSRFITFQERSLTDAFTPGRELGFLFGNTVFKKRATWALSVTRPTLNDVSAFQGVDVGLRLTGLPWWQDKGKRLVHVGFDYYFQDTADNATVRYRTRPEARLDFPSTSPAASGRFIDSGNIPARYAHNFDIEAAMVYGPLSLQGEFMWGLMNSLPFPDSTPLVKDEVARARFYGFYIFGSFFLTGEHRPYSTSSAAFGRPIPRRNFNLRRGGLGAWEVALRFSMLDETDANTIANAGAAGVGQGGKETNITFGLNWYPNPNSRVILNYVYGWLNDLAFTAAESFAGVPVTLRDDTFSVFMMRFQVDF
jgi:phosphate-selective porin OprO/OprP